MAKITKREIMADLVNNQGMSVREADKEADKILKKLERDERREAKKSEKRKKKADLLPGLEGIFGDEASSKELAIASGGKIVRSNKRIKKIRKQQKAAKRLLDVGETEFGSVWSLIIGILGMILVGILLTPALGGLGAWLVGIAVLAFGLSKYFINENLETGLRGASMIFLTVGILLSSFYLFAIVPLIIIYFAASSDAIRMAIGISIGVAIIWILMTAGLSNLIPGYAAIVIALYVLVFLEESSEHGNGKSVMGKDGGNS